MHRCLHSPGKPSPYFSKAGPGAEKTKAPANSLQTPSGAPELGMTLRARVSSWD